MVRKINTMSVTNKNETNKSDKSDENDESDESDESEKSDKRDWIIASWEMKFITLNDFNQFN